MVKSLKRLYHLGVAVLANIWFGFPGRKLTVIGVTGTDGKTTTATLIYEILTSAGKKTSMITSVHAVIAGKEYDTGFHVTTPSAFHVQKFLSEAANHGDTHFVLEVTSHGLDQYRVWGIPFTVGVITNVTHEHLDWHGTFIHYLTTKLRLFKRSTIAVINRDQEDLYINALPIVTNRRYITYGIHHNCTVSPKTYRFKQKIPGDFNTYNILAALAATCEALNINKRIATQAISGFTGVPGRMEVVFNKSFRVIIDFAHTPNAFEEALKTVRENARGRVIHIFGCASERDRLKRPIMGKISSQYADIIILTEEDYRHEHIEAIMDEIAHDISSEKEVHRFPNRQDAVTYGISLAKSGDTVILTGKAHEKSLARDGREYPWNEYKAVKIALSKRGIKG